MNTSATTLTSVGSASSGEFTAIAPNDRTMRTPSRMNDGRASRAAPLIVCTSRVTRVTRSPELAASMRDSGSASTNRTTFSRAVASTLCPNTTDSRFAANVVKAWTTTMPATTAASLSSCTSSPPMVAWSTRSPSSFGTARPATAASTLPTTSPMNSPRRDATSSFTNRTAADDGATGRPRTGDRVLAK